MKTVSYKRQFTSSILKCTAIALVSLSIPSYGQITSAGNGNWNTAGTWSPAGVPSGAEKIIVDHAVALDKDLTNGSGISGLLQINAGRSLMTSTTSDLAVKNGGTLDVYGTLDVNNLEFANGSTIYIASTAQVIVRNDFSNNNNSVNVIINGTLTVYGNAYNGAGGVISGTGTVSLLGGGFTGGGIITGTIVLPVDLLYFEAKDEKEKVKVSWGTASEAGNGIFTLEKSFDGNTFSAIGTKKGSGNSTVQNDYSLTDEVSSGIVYYRLKQTDQDGKFSYYGPISFRSKNGGTDVKVYPNPVGDNGLNVVVNYHESSAGTEILITDMSGKGIYRFYNDDSASSISIPRIVLKHGSYMLSIKTGNAVISKKILVE